MTTVIETKRTITLHMLSTALSPITHMGGTRGNEAILNRERVIYNGEVVEVPFLSGNALRHRMIREPGATYLVDAYRLRKQLTIDQANYMFNGGVLSASSNTDNMPLIAEMQRTLPLFRLLGGSLRSQIISGSLNVSRGVLVCQENLETIARSCPALADLEKTHAKAALEFVGSTQYTRGDVRKAKDAEQLLAPSAQLLQDEKSNLMIYNGECVMPGAMFYHNVLLRNVSDVEIGAVLHALAIWQRHGGSIGGSSRIGHGRLESVLWCDEPLDATELAVQYIQHVEAHEQDAVAWLGEAFQ
ncbi:MAG: hypothetical protein GX838_07095 [Clostridiaceae bacterium]|nr:hypothetical protein [Clostridiaceae bacterium]